MRFLFIIFIPGIIISCSKEKMAGEFDEEYQIVDDFIPKTETIDLALNDLDKKKCFFENNFVKLVADDSNIKSYSWFISRTGNKDEFISNDSDLFISETGNYFLRVTYFTPKGGKKDSTIHIELSHCRTSIEIPSSFIPNNDGQFDTWFPILFGVSDFYVRISNDNSNVIFESTSEQNVFKGDFNNEKLPSGSYLYYISGTYKSGYLFEKQGVLELVR